MTFVSYNHVTCKLGFSGFLLGISSSKSFFADTLMWTNCGMCNQVTIPRDRVSLLRFRTWPCFRRINPDRVERKMFRMSPGGQQWHYFLRGDVCRSIARRHDVKKTITLVIFTESTFLFGFGATSVIHFHPNYGYQYQINIKGDLFSKSFPFFLLFLKE